MKSKWTKVAVSSITALSIMAAIPAMPVSYASAAVQQQTTVIPQKVNIADGINATIRNAQIMVQENGRVLAFTVAIENNSKSSLNLIDYWVRVKNKNGKKFTVKLSDMDRKKNAIVGGTTGYLTYYAVVDPQTKLNDIVFDMIKWDFSVSNYERNLGSISTPSNMVGQTAFNKTSNILLENTEISNYIKSVLVTKDQVNTNATIEFNLKNSGSKTVDLSKLSFFVQTSDFTVYPVEVFLKKNVLSPKEDLTAVMNISVPNSAATKPLAIVPAIAEAESKVLLPLGSYSLPALQVSKPVKVNGTETIKYDEQLLQTKVLKSELFDVDGRNEVKIDFQFNNKSKKTTDLLNIEFLLETESGIQYPLVIDKPENLKILPEIVKNISVNGAVPNNLNLNKSKLVLKTASTENSKSYTLAIYQLKAEKAVESSDLFYKNKDYQVDLKSINRIPDDTDDILVSELTIKNNHSDKAIKVPALSGQFVLDGVQLETVTNEVSLDQAINLPPNATYQIAVYTKIPYTTYIKDVSFVLTEKQKEQDAKKLFQYKAQLPEVVGQSIKSPYVIENIGRKASIQVIRAAINGSKSNNANYFYGEFALTNKELRTVSVTQLGGYLEDSTGLLIPVTFTPVEDRILPNGKALYAAFGRIPQEFNNKDYKLYIGQAMPVGSGDTSSSILVSPVAYNMSTATGINTTLQQIMFGGFNFDVLEVFSNVKMKDNYTYEGIELRLKYNLNKNNEYQVTPKGQKIIVELVDQGTAKATYSKEFELSGEKDIIALGNDISLPILFEDEKMMTKINSFNNFDLNIYAAFGDNKLLLASKELKWFFAEKLAEQKKN